MANNNLLTVLALIIGVAGIGLGGYSLFAIQTGILPEIASLDDDVGDMEEDVEDVEDTIGTINIPTTVIKGVWYDTDLFTYAMPVGNGEIPGLSVNITVNSGEKVHILFTCYTHFEAGTRWVYFFAYADDVKITPVIYTYIVLDEPDGPSTFCVALQGVALLSAGKHEISIYHENNNDATNFCDEKHLFVYTYV